METATKEKTMPTWRRTADGYQSTDGSAEIIDNGAGVGPSRDSGRWALMMYGRWVANIDTLAEAKAAAVTEEELRKYEHEAKRLLNAPLRLTDKAENAVGESVLVLVAALRACRSQAPTSA